MKYRVQFYDSPKRIAASFSVPFAALIAANPQKQTTVVNGEVTWSDIRAGELISVPVPGTIGLAPTNKYVVQSGDTGEKVAAKLVGDKGRWRELLTTNPNLKDPKYGIALYVGKTITLPASWVDATPVAVPVVTSTPAMPPPQVIPVTITPSPSGTTYTVKSGDTGEKLALAFTGDKGRWPELVKANPTLADPKYGIALYAGKTINLPASWASGGGTPVAPPSLPPPVAPPAIVPPPLPPVAPSTPVPQPPPIAVVPVVTPAAIPTAVLALTSINPCDQANAGFVQQAQAALGQKQDAKYGDITAAAARKLVPNAPAGCSPAPLWWGTKDTVVAPLPPQPPPPVQVVPSLPSTPSEPIAVPVPVPVPVVPGGAAPAPSEVVVAPEPKKGLSTGAIVAGAVGAAALVGIVAMAASGKKGPRGAHGSPGKRGKRGASRKAPKRRSSKRKHK